MTTPRQTRHPFYVHRCLRTVTAALAEAGVRGEPVLLGVSGGSDSMAMLELAGMLAAGHELRLHVACVDHGLRPEAAAEVRLVAGAAARWGAEFHALRVDPGGDDEDSLRDARHAVLESLRFGVGSRFVLLGHTADDQVETIVFRFLRGAGFGGLAGMQERRGTLLRPMLGLRRDELRRLLEARGVAWAEDPTNASLRYARGRLRSRVLPALASAFGTGALEHLLDVAPRWRADEDFLEQETARLLAYASRRGRRGVDLDMEALRVAHPALRARALRRWIMEATAIQPASRDIAAIERWLDGNAGPGGLDLAGARLESAAGRLTIEPATASRVGTGDGKEPGDVDSVSASDDSSPSDADHARAGEGRPARGGNALLPPSDGRVRVPRK